MLKNVNKCWFESVAEVVWSAQYRKSATARRSLTNRLTPHFYCQTKYVCRRRRAWKSFAEN